jgi:predicted permease
LLDIGFLKMSRNIQSVEKFVKPIMLNWTEQFCRDVRFAVRGLARTPAFTALAVTSLALGIMATTTIYSVLHAVVLDPFPYKDVDRLMSVKVSSPAFRGFRVGYSVEQFLEIAERARVFDGVIASTISDVLWTGDGGPQRLRGNHGTFNTFEVMGVPPLLGRTPAASDARPGAEPVVVLGYRFWQRQFAGDPNVLGRLRSGVTDAEAEADLSPIIADLKRREPSQFPDRWRVGLLPFKQTFPSAITRDIWVLLGAVALLLLIACANVSNLLLSRASTRQREMTVRVALGASRRRLVRQLLTESLMLALAAGTLGTVLAYAGLPALLALVPPGRIPDESEIQLNTPVLVFVLLLSAGTSVICGLAPALHASGRDLARSMREAGRGLAGNSRQAMVRKTLVIAEVALSLMLLAGSSVLLRTFMAMENIDLGVPPEQVLTMRVPLPAQHYPDARRRIAFFQELLPRVRASPGVAAAGLNSGLHPLGNMRTPAEVRGEPPNNEPVQVHQINAGYTNALGIRLAAGRMLTDTDVERVQQVALVNEQFVRTRLNGRAPLGRMVKISRLKEPPFNFENDSFQIVGVVHDKLNAGLTDPVVPEVYLPFTAAGIANLLVVRANGDPADVTRAVVSQVYAVDKGQPVTAVMTLDRLLKDNQYATPRFNLILLTMFAAFGLVLAVVGVYGVMSSAVAQARQEIGVRMALGADGGAIVRMVVARGARLLLAGTAIGLVGSVAAGRWLTGEVWRVAAVDPAAFGGVSLLLLAAGLQACFWPARRAARTDPLAALREE